MVRAVARLAWGLAVIGCVGAVGCGSSHKNTTTSNAAATPSTTGSSSSGGGLNYGGLASQANAICRQVTPQRRAVGPLPADFRTNPVSAAAYLDKAVPIVDQVLVRLAALKPIPADKAGYDQFLAAWRAPTQALDSARVKAHARDPSGYADFQRVSVLARAADFQVRKLGADACAGG